MYCVITASHATSHRPTDVYIQAVSGELYKCMYTHVHECSLM